MKEWTDRRPESNGLVDVIIGSATTRCTDSDVPSLWRITTDMWAWSPTPEPARPQFVDAVACGWAEARTEAAA